MVSQVFMQPGPWISHMCLTASAAALLVALPHGVTMMNFPFAATLTLLRAFWWLASGSPETDPVTRLPDLSKGCKPTWCYLSGKGCWEGVGGRVKENNFQTTSIRRAVFIHFLRRTNQCETQSKEDSNANFQSNYHYIVQSINISLRVTSKASLTNSGCNWSYGCN